MGYKGCIMARKVTIIGDVHGCSSELARLLDQIPSDGEIVFLGDLVGKGPDTPGVLSAVKNLKQTRKVTIIEGNHEMKALKALKRQDPGGELHGVAPALIDALSGMVPYVRFPDLGIVVVHGGITPTIKEMPVDYSELAGKNKKRVGRSMFIRHAVAYCALTLAMTELRSRSRCSSMSLFAKRRRRPSRMCGRALAATSR